MLDFRPFIRLAGLAVCLAALSTPRSAPAATVPAFSLAGLVAAADAVTTGTVIDNHSIWNAFPGLAPDIYTITEIAISRSLKGSDTPHATMFVMQIGGVVDGRERTVAGTARFEPGDRVLLFTRTDGAMHYLVGMGQGAFFFADTHRSGSTVVPPRWVRRALPTRVTPSPGTPVAEPAPDTWLEDALIKEIQRLVAIANDRGQP